MPLTWKNRPFEAPPPDLDSLAAKLQVSPRIIHILWTRGLHKQADMDRFLSPGLKHLPPLKKWPGLAEAAQIAAKSLEQGKKPAIWGDYDVDGVTSTALLSEFLQMRGFEPMHHLPRRQEEGYGLNTPGVEDLAARGAGLLITVDCGISDAEPVARAKQLGMDVIITDHHLPGDQLPPADAVVNPRLGDSPSMDLAGVGVAFLLAAAMNNALPGEKIDVRRFLDLVALGTIADVVPLSDLNRILVKNGLLMIAEAGRPGIAALKEASSYNPRAPLTAGQVAFGLAPRINAAGRMGEADTAFELMLAADLDTARPRAARLDAMNTDRRRIEDRILAEAMEQAKQQQDRQALVLHSPEWHSGVIGIVASRVAEAFYRPVLILCREDGYYKGSGRSISEVDLHAALTCCSSHLARFGGHRQAAGVTLEPENLEAFAESFNAAVSEQTGGVPVTPSLYVDGELGFSEIDFTLLKELDLLQPFGIANPEPVFISPRVAVTDHRVFGKNHVKLALRDEAAGVTFSAKAWRQAENMPHDMRGRVLRVVFTPKIDYYGGVPTIDLNIKDWKEEGS